MIAMAENDDEIDDLPFAVPKMSGTPRELHATGLMTVARAARFIGFSADTFARKVANDEIPHTRPLGGNPRIEPLVAWAMRQGATATTVKDVAVAIASGACVDDVVAIVTGAKPAEKKTRRSGKTKTTSGGAA